MFKDCKVCLDIGLISDKDLFLSVFLVEIIFIVFLKIFSLFIICFEFVMIVIFFFVFKSFVI